ncbi:hypothetical protein Pmani_008142 [Petrolisthes manimaculis]|uniref:Uncharacterized protein n=1 Tax=Petrolisthes manimaculis TaxID=1843537 RepID=A0AAE1UJY7_9EUCA|nr:hypothetical protein Pmani_008142 [Petrolisthes manimaculis]
MLRKVLWINIVFHFICVADQRLTIQYPGEDDVSELGRLAGPLCKEADSLTFLHDDSPRALVLLHFLLHHFLASNPSQVVSLYTLGVNKHWSTYGFNHNLELGLVVVVFENNTLVQSLLGAEVEGRLVHGPLLLLALNHHKDNRETLWAVSSARYSGLVQPVVLPNGDAVGFTFTTFFPFNHPSENFHIQVLQPHMGLRWDQFIDKFINFNEHTLHLASWVDDFPMMFWADTSKSH